MFGNFSQQLKKSTKPASTLLAMNAKTLEQVSKYQTELFSGVVADSAKLMDSLFSQSEIKGVMAAQTAYAESLKERVTTASKSTYGSLSSYGKEAAVVMKASLETVAEDTKASVDTAVTKTAKAAPKAASKTEAKKAPSKSPAKAASTTKAAAKATVKKTVASKAPSKKPAAKAVAKKVVATKADAAPTPKLEAAPVSKTVKVQATPPVVEKPVAKKPAAPKKAASTAKKPTVKKTVAKLSPADVKAATAKSK